MAEKKKIKLKGSSFFDKNKPINKIRKTKSSSPKENNLHHKKPLKLEKIQLDLIAIKHQLQEQGIYQILLKRDIFSY